jgi:hypothetical protein
VIGVGSGSVTFNGVIVPNDAAYLDTVRVGGVSSKVTLPTFIFRFVEAPVVLRSPPRVEPFPEEPSLLFPNNRELWGPVPEPKKKRKGAVT